MKKTLLMILVIPLLCQAKPAHLIIIKNPAATTLRDYCVVIEREKLRQAENDIYPVFIDSRSGEMLPSQVDDMNGDKIWDETAFLVTLSEKERLKIKIDWRKMDRYPEFPIRTNIYFGVSRERDGEYIEVSQEILPPKYECGTPYQYQFEGVGWENDKIGFRTYCDMRNGKDIFAKTGSDMVLNNIGKGENYHDAGDWGMDILKVGSSLGIGAIAVLDNDNLYRLSDTKYHDFKTITEGPVRSVFELNFKGWNINRKELSAKETITIGAGRNGFKNRVEISGDDPPDQLVSGLSLVGNDGIPGTIHFDHAHGIFVVGINDIDDQFLGMSVLIEKDKNFTAAFSKTTNEVYDTSSKEYNSTKYHTTITDTYYLATPGTKAEFIVNCMWEGRYSNITSREDYQKMLEEDMLNYFIKTMVKIK